MRMIIEESERLDNLLIGIFDFPKWQMMPQDIQYDRRQP